MPPPDQVLHVKLLANDVIMKVFRLVRRPHNENRGDVNSTHRDAVVQSEYLLAGKILC